MADTPRLGFLSLFVPDLDEAAKRYEAIFGVAPCAGETTAPRKHPFSTRPAVIFQLGTVEIALYQTDGKTTHTGDVGIGLLTAAAATDMGDRATRAGARVFPGLPPLADDGRKMVVFMTTDRHFFEVVSGERAVAR